MAEAITDQEPNRDKITRITVSFQMEKHYLLFPRSNQQTSQTLSKMVIPKIRNRVENRIPAEEVKDEKHDEEALPDYIANFNDTHGWFHAFFRAEYSWRGSRPRPRLFFPAKQEYNPVDEYLAVDGLGRKWKGNIPFSCTINPKSGKFERLCVQTRDSICTLNNSTWERTIIRNSGPRIFRIANFPTRIIPPGRRHRIALWNQRDWELVLTRWIPSVLGIFILVSTSKSSVL
jgi:hypothetical protein